MSFLKYVPAVSALSLWIAMSALAHEGGVTHGGGGDGMTGGEIIMEALHDEGFTITPYRNGNKGAVKDVSCRKPHGARAYTECQATDIATGRVINLQYPHPFATGITTLLGRQLKIVRDVTSEHFFVSQLVCKERYPYDMDTTCQGFQ